MVDNFVGEEDEELNYTLSNYSPQQDMQTTFQQTLHSTPTHNIRQNKHTIATSNDHDEQLFTSTNKSTQTHQNTENNDLVMSNVEKHDGAGGEEEKSTCGIDPHHSPEGFEAEVCLGHQKKCLNFKRKILSSVVPVEQFALDEHFDYDNIPNLARKFSPEIERRLFGK